ncbi:hypothetical protein IID22_04190, partial [Patescibacteria group bacterium]|nr:hypothetical protein [Patescibacteria group bacterium]
NVLFGTAAVYVTYLMVSELWRLGRNKKNKLQITNYRLLAAIAALLLAVSPWHISLSRGAFEANLSSFFLPLAVWGFIKGINKPRWMAVSALAFGLNLFSYHVARIFTPFVIAMIIFHFRKELFNGNNFYSAVSGAVTRYKRALVLIILFVVLALMTIASGAGTRGLDISIFNPTDRWAAMSDRRYEAILQGMPDQVSRVFSNKIVYVGRKFINNYVSYLSPQFLFTQGAGEWTYGMISGRGVLYLIELPFLLAAIWFIAKRGFTRSRALTLIFVWVLIAPIPAALTKGPGFAANRAAVMMPWIQIVVAFGAVTLYERITAVWKQRWLRKLLLYGFIVSMFISLVFFLEDYLYHAPLRASSSMHQGKGSAIKFVNELEDQYDEIVLSRTLSTPNIWLAFYTAYDPDSYQKASKDWLRYEDDGFQFLDQLSGYRLGKYTFGDINLDRAEKEKKILFVSTPGEVQREIEYLDTVYYPDGNPAIYIFDNQAL